MRLTHLFVPLLAVVAVPAAAAKEKHQHKHSHKAHSHGDAKLDVAVDGKLVVVKFEAPGDVVFGFEHKAKTETHKKTIETEMKRLNEQHGELLKFPSDAMCVLSEKSVKADQADNGGEEEKKGKEVHADVDVTWKFMCHSELSGKVLKLGFFAAYPRLKTLKTQVLGSSGQKGLTLKNDKTDLTL